MAVNFPNSPSVGDIHQDGGKIWQWDGSLWRATASIGPGTVVTELTDGVAFTPPAGSVSHQVHLWGPGDDEPEITNYSQSEMGASATVNIGTEADGTNSTFNPAGSGATLTATAGYPAAWHLLETGSKSGATSYDWDITQWTSYKIIQVDVMSIVYSSYVSTYEDLYLRFSDDGGSTFVDGNLYYNYFAFDDAGVTDTIETQTRRSQTEVFITDAEASGEVPNCGFTLYDPHNTSYDKAFTFYSNYWGAGSDQLGFYHGGGIREAADDITDFQLVNRYGAPANVSFDYRIMGVK